MKLALNFKYLLSASLLVLSSIAIPSKSNASPQQGIFSCGSTGNGIPATVFTANGGGSNAIFQWDSGFFAGSGYTPQVRCDIVSSKMESNRSSGNMQYFVGGQFNGYKVICASRTSSSGIKQCQDSEVLFTLKPTDDTDQVLAYIVAKNLDKSLPPLGLHDSPLLRRTDGRYVVDVNRFIRYTPTGYKNQPPQTRPNPIRNPRPQPSQNCGWLSCN